jgi:MFS family permease
MVDRQPVGRFLPLLLTAALVDWIGTGLFLAVSSVFFVRVVGLSVAAVGSGLTVAALAAMPAAIPAGRLADRFGPRPVLVAVEVIQGIATAGYLVVRNWPEFVAVTFAVAVTQQTAPPLIQSLVGELATGERRPRILAAHRTVINIGIATGSLVAGLVLGRAGPGAYQALLLADVAAFFVAAGLLLAIPVRARRRPRAARSRYAAVRDPRLIALTSYDALMSLWQPILNVAFPLWLITHTDAPASLIGMLYAVASAGAILLQYPVGILATTTRRARHGYTAAAICFAAASAGFAATSSAAGRPTVILLCISILTLTVGEVAQVGSAWTLSFAIAPADDRNTYLAAFGTGRAFSRACGPALMTGVVIALGTTGWIALAALFAAASAAPVIVGRRYSFDAVTRD